MTIVNANRDAVLRVSNAACGSSPKRTASPLLARTLAARTPTILQTAAVLPGSVALISLIVSGIAIAMVMLISVTERTR